MFYIYIIYSASSDVFYVGYSNDPQRRLIEHNNKPFNSFTAKHRPWIPKAVFNCGAVESHAINIERFIKQQKSRKLIEKICDPTYTPDGRLSMLVRVPDVRD